MNRLLHTSQQLAVLIKTARKARQLTQAEVAARLGVSQNRFSELERDASGLTVERLLVLAPLLGLDILVQKSDARPAGVSEPAAADW